MTQTLTLTIDHKMYTYGLLTVDRSPLTQRITHGLLTVDRSPLTLIIIAFMTCNYAFRESDFFYQDNRLRTTDFVHKVYQQSIPKDC